MKDLSASNADRMPKSRKSHLTYLMSVECSIGQDSMYVLSEYVEWKICWVRTMHSDHECCLLKVNTHVYEPSHKLDRYYYSRYLIVYIFAIKTINYATLAGFLQFFLFLWDNFQDAFCDQVFVCFYYFFNFWPVGMTPCNQCPSSPNTLRSK